MKPAAVAVAALLSVSLGVPAPSGGPRWRLQYFYDPPDGAQFAIYDMAFASPARGMAIGVVEDERKTKPYAVATADGGETWVPVRLPESPLSLFLLSEKAGWLVGKDDIWRTADFGLTWKKLARAPGTTHVHFLDEQHGWAIGAKKSVQETADGGASWTVVPAAAEPKTTAEFTEYASIAFATPTVGMIAGWSKPPRRGGAAYQIPDWVDPEESGRREWPSVTVTLETQDGGTHWKVGQTSMFGQITNLSLAPDGRGLGLVEFFDKFEFPSEVFRLDLKSGKSERVFRRKDRAVTDVLLPAAGPAFLVAVEPPGTLPRSPVPGKLKILSSSDLEHWEEMPVDYRAVARRANLAGAAPSGAWVATDTGMILKLTTQ